MTYVENQATVSKWATDTFGPVGSNARVAARANEEMAELLRAVTADAPVDLIAAEAADVVIVLYRIAERLGHQLDASKPYHDPYDEWPYTPSQIAARANRVLGRALQYLTAEPSEVWLTVVREDLDGVVVFLARLAEDLGFDLRAEIDKKMAINRAREWKLDGTGHGYHVRNKTKPEVPGPPLVTLEQWSRYLNLTGQIREVLCVDVGSSDVEFELQMILEAAREWRASAAKAPELTRCANHTADCPQCGAYLKQLILREPDITPQDVGFPGRVRREKAKREECPCPDTFCVLPLGHAGDHEFAL